MCAARIEYSEQHPRCAIKGSEPIRRFALQEEDVEVAARFASEVFTAGEPLCRALALTSDDMFGFCLSICRAAARQGLGVVARNSADAIVAFSISERWPSDIVFGAECERLGPINEFLGQMEHDFDRRHSDDKAALHLFIIGTRKDYEGRGIVKTLVADNQEQARRAGLPRVYTEATSNSQFLFASLGYSTQLELPYADFEFQGARPFASIDSPTSAQLMELEL